MRREGKLQRRGPFAAVYVASFAIVAVAGSTSPGMSVAQSQPTTQSILSRMVGTVDADGHARLTLTFAPSTPKFAIIGNDTVAPSIALAATAKGPRASAQSLPASLASLSLDQTDTVLLLKVPASLRTHVTATAHGLAALDF